MPREPLAHARRLERAAVEEDRVGPRRARARLARGLALAREERGDVARDRRVGGVRQAELVEPGPRLRRGRASAATRGKKPSSTVRVDLVARERRRERAADDRAAAARRR